MLIRSIPRAAIAALVAVPAFAAGIALSASASGAPSTTYYGCLYKGALSKITTAAHTCPTGYKVASWSAVGPQGIQGARGPQGLQGVPGATGPAGQGTSMTPADIATLDWSHSSFSGRNLSDVGFGLNGPRRAAFDGSHVWVPNGAVGGGVSEFNASTGAWIRTLNGGSYGFNEPYSAAYDGRGHVWITSLNAGLTEVNASDGSWIQTIAIPSPICGPVNIAMGLTKLWVTCVIDGSVVTIDAASGSLTNRAYAAQIPNLAAQGPMAFDGKRMWFLNGSDVVIGIDEGFNALKLSGGSYAFNGVSGIAFDGAHMWVVNYTGASVTEFDAATGAFIRTVSGPAYGFNQPTSIAFDGTNLWITNSGAHSVIEIKASDGSYVRTLSAAEYGFNNPGFITFDGTNLWVSNSGSDSVSEIMP